MYIHTCINTFCCRKSQTKMRTFKLKTYYCFDSSICTHKVQYNYFCFRSWKNKSRKDLQVQSLVLAHFLAYVDCHLQIKCLMRHNHSLRGHTIKNKCLLSIWQKLPPIEIAFLQHVLRTLHINSDCWSMLTNIIQFCPW